MVILINKNTIHWDYSVDDQVGFPKNRESIEYAIRNLKEEFEVWGFTINMIKTDVSDKRIHI